MNRAQQAVASTGLLVAAIRARESTRPQRLFTDPFAERLAGPEGRRLLDEALATSGEPATLQIVVRTRYWDDALLAAAGDVRQVVILAAGMDARAYRLTWPQGTTVFELDQPDVIARKTDVLATDTPRCHRVAIGVDLADDWPGALIAAGFDTAAPSVWLIEGLLQYLDETAVRTLFARIDHLSTRGSVLLYDIVGKALLESEFMAPLLRAMADQGSPWLFGTDDPGELAEGLGWTAMVTDIAEPGNRWNRWFAPATPSGVTGAPRGYFVSASR